MSTIPYLSASDVRLNPFLLGSPQDGTEIDTNPGYVGTGDPNYPLGSVTTCYYVDAAYTRCQQDPYLFAICSAPYTPFSNAINDGSLVPTTSSVTGGTLSAVQLSIAYANYLTTPANLARVELEDFYAQRLTAQLIQSMVNAYYSAIVFYYNPTATGVVNTYNAEAFKLNQNPAVANPVATVGAEVAKVQQLVANQVASISLIIASLSTEANRQIAAARATADAQIASALATATSTATFAQQEVERRRAAAAADADARTKAAQAEVARQQAIAQAAIKTYTDTVNATLAATTTEVNRQRAILEAEAKKQQDAAVATITNEQAKAMLLINATIALLLKETGNAIATLTTTVGTATGIVLAQLSQIQQQLVDRPLFYGALTTPITIANTTDVIVIPPGGLVITAD